jgi:hypothetical protein
MDGGLCKRRKTVCEITSKGSATSRKPYFSERKRDERSQRGSSEGQVSQRESQWSQHNPSRNQTHTGNNLTEACRGGAGGGGRGGDGVRGDGFRDRDGDGNGDGDSHRNDRHQEKEERQRREGTGGTPGKALNIYLNARSIVKKIDELACVASTLQPDLILITESWCNSEISDAFLSVEGYEVQPDLRLDRQDTAQGRGGGLLVYVRHGVKILNIDRNITFHQYCKFLISDVTLYLIYRTPNAPAQSILELEQIVRAAERNSILIGDFNLPDIDWSMGTCSSRFRPFVEAVEDSMMEQLVEFSTQVKGNCLDLVLN